MKVTSTDALLAASVAVAIVAVIASRPLLVSLWTIIHSNSILQAVFVPSMVGTVLYVLRFVVMQVYAKIRGRRW